VWRASSLLMNPSLRAGRLERERRLDASRYAREYEAEFADDVAAFLPAAWVDDAVVAGRRELPPRAGVRYFGAVDPSGGGADAFTLAIVHAEGEVGERRVVQDVMRGWNRRGADSPDLEGMVREIAVHCRSYNVSTVIGDRYAAGWVRERFRAEGLRYQEAEIRVPDDPTAMRYLDKSLAYLEMEPFFAQGRVELLDHSQLARELKLLERRARAGGRTLVDHPTGGHDDYANALALATVLAVREPVRPWAMSRLPLSENVIGSPRDGASLGKAGWRGGGGLAPYIERWSR